jgi:hypothetical protein
MRPHLTFEHFAAVLAALGTSTAIACGGGTPQPVHANEVPAAGTATPGHASCSANGCSGKTVGAQPDAPATAGAGLAAPASTTSSTASAASASTATTAATAAADSSPPAASAAAAAPATTTKAPGKTPAKKAATPKPSSAGEASCGAGTCSSDMKKKIL